MADSSQEEKQQFLREKILDKGIDANLFVQFLLEKKGDDASDITNWTMNDLKIVVQEFYEKNNINDSNNENLENNNVNIEQKIENNPQKENIDKNPSKTNIINSQKEISSPQQNIQKEKPKKKENDKDEDLPKIDELFLMQYFFKDKILKSTLPPDFIENTKIEPPNIKKETISLQNTNNSPELVSFNFPKEQEKKSNTISNEDNSFNFKANEFVFEENNFNKNDFNNKNNDNKNDINNKNNDNNKINISNEKPENKETNNIENKKEIKENNIQKNTDIQKPFEYGVTTSDFIECQKNEMTEFMKYDNIHIKISDPIKTEGGFFGGSSTTYLVTTSCINSQVRRKYADFVWLRDILINIYNLNVIPKITKKGKISTDKFTDIFINKRMDSLERFINYLIKDNLLKNSQIFYDFLTVEKEEDFSNKKKIFEKMSIPSETDIKNRKCLSGTKNILINKEKKKYFENIKDNSMYNGNLFKKLNSHFKLLKDEYESVIKRFELISSVFSELYENSKKFLDNNTIQESYKQMSTMFSNFAEISKHNRILINTGMREYFKFTGNIFNYIKELSEKVEEHKNNYNKFYKNLINKKTDLYKKGDISKWDLDSKDKCDKNTLMNDKNLALSKILNKDTKNCIILKQIYGYYLNGIIEEYERIKHLISVSHKEKIISFCKEQTEEFSDYIRVLGDITSIIDSLVNSGKEVKNNGRNNVENGMN